MKAKLTKQQKMKADELGYKSGEEDKFLERERNEAIRDSEKQAIQNNQTLADELLKPIQYEVESLESKLRQIEKDYLNETAERKTAISKLHSEAQAFSDILNEIKPKFESLCQRVLSVRHSV